MMSRVRVRRQALALVAAGLLAFISVAGAFANAPNPGSIGASVSGSTVTVSGSWAWPGIDKCDGRQVGWAVDWGDPNDPGNAVAKGFNVGTRSDNSVHTNGDCGAVSSGKDRAGSWGGLSHTYSAPGTYTVCAVTYDVHVDAKSGAPQAGDLVAGGTSRNKDNSVEANGQAPTSPGCTTATIATPAKVSARMSVNQATANPGDTLTYTIGLANSGGTAGSVDVTDNIAALLAHGSFAGASAGGGLNGNSVTWSGVNVAAGGSTSLSFSVRLNTGGWTAGTTSLPNTVVVPDTNCASGSSDTSCRTATTVSSTVNLVVKATVNKATANPGDTLAYTIAIQNTGGADATGVSASASIAALLSKGTFGGASDGGSVSGSSVVWSGLGVPSGGTQTLTYSVTLTSSGWGSGTTALPTTVVVPTSDCASGSSNASCRTSTTVTTAPNLVVRQSVDQTSANPGDTLDYTITIQNSGNGDASNLDVTDSISALLAHGSLGSVSGGGSLGGSTITWPNQAVAAGASLTLTFSVKLDSTGWPAGTTSLPNTVVVPNSDCASGSSNAACRVTTTVTARPNLVVRKSVSAGSANPGDTLSYTITVQNTGNASATGVDVTDDISALLAHGSLGGVSGGGSLGSGTLRWSNLTVAQGATTTLTFSVGLDTTGWATGTTVLPNTVVVANSDCASGSSNTACRVSTSVTAHPNLVVHKSVSATSANPGDTLSYTISVQNTGNATASGVDVTDDISVLLAHGSLVSTGSGGSLSGSSLQWTNQSFAPGASHVYTFTIRLDLDGWATGTTNLPNVVVVAGSDCAAGASNGACRVTTTVTPRFGLALTKSVSGGSSGPWQSSYSATAGDTVWYQIRVTNTGNATLGGLHVTDSQGIPSGQCAAPPSTLDPGAAWTCVYFKTAVEGTTTNTATADSTQTAAVSDTATLTAGPVPAPAIRIAKSASPSQLPVGGGNVTYTFTVTNPGNVPISGVTVTDDQCAPVTFQGGDTNGNGRLDPTETWRYTCGATVTSTTTDTATATGTYGSTRVSDSDRVTVTVIVAAPAIHLQKSASRTQLPVGGGQVTYTYTVTNVGNAALGNVSVTDDKCAPVTYASGDTNNNGKLDLAEVWRFTCTSTISTTTTNHARVQATAGDVAVADTDEVTVTVASSQPGIRVVKAANPTSLPPGGGQVTYTYVVTNTGNTPLTSVSLADDRCPTVTFQGGDANGDARLDVGETWQYRCTQTIGVTTTNTVTARAQAGGTTVTDTDQATVAVTASTPAISVVKSASPTTLPAGGGSVTYTYTVTNKGNVALTSVSVVDDKCDSVTRRGGDTNGNGKLDLGETWSYTCTATITATTTNTALATGFFNATPVTDTDTALVTVGTPAGTTPRIGLALSADPVLLPENGGTVTYTYIVMNKGDVALSSVTVTDNVCSPMSAPSGDANGNGRLEVGETWTFTCATVITSDTTSTATASGQADGQTVQAVDMVSVSVTPPAPTPSPTQGAPSASPGESPTASPGESPGTSPGTSPGGSTSGSPAPSGATGSPAASDNGTGGSGATAGASASPTGLVAGVISPPKSSAQPNTDGTPTAATANPGATPSPAVMLLVLMLGIVAAVLIMTLSKRTSSA